MSVQFWMVPVLGSVVVLGVVAVFLLARSWPRTGDLTAEERREMADVPMPSMQRSALAGFVLGVAMFGVISWILSTRGAMTYWEDDGLRLLVLGLFLVGLIGTAVVTNLPILRAGSKAGLDERDQAVIARAPTAQATLVLLALAAWMVVLGERFHDEGAVPVVYLYLIFGSAVLLMMIGQSLGILLGYWLGGKDA